MGRIGCQGLQNECCAACGRHGAGEPVCQNRHGTSNQQCNRVGRDLDGRQVIGRTDQLDELVDQQDEGPLVVVTTGNRQLPGCQATSRAGGKVQLVHLDGLMAPAAKFQRCQIRQRQQGHSQHDAHAEPHRVEPARRSKAQPLRVVPHV